MTLPDSFIYDNFKNIFNNKYISDQLRSRTDETIFYSIKKYINDHDRTDNIKLYNYILKISKNLKKETNVRVLEKINYYSIKKLYDFMERIEQWSNFMKKKNKVALDLGAGRGTKTIILRKFLKIKLENIYCLDLETTNFAVHTIRNACQFRFYKGDIFPFDDNTFDLVTIFLVIHHVKNLTDFILEIKRTLKKDGFLIIREHDINKEEDKNNMILLHLLYYLKELIAYDKIEISFYRSAKEIIKSFEKNDFKFIKLSNASPFTNSRYFVFQLK